MNIQVKNKTMLPTPSRASSSVSAWGASPVLINNATDDYDSLQSIMDETLARKLQDEADVADYHIIGGTEDVESPSDTESLQSCPSIDHSTTSATELMAADADYALAVSLQAQEEEAYTLRKDATLGKSNNHHVSGTSSVRIQYRDDPYALQLRAMDLEHSVASCVSRNEEDTLNEKDHDHDNDQEDPSVKFRPRGFKKGLKQSGRVEKERLSCRQGVLDAKTRLLVHQLTNAGLVESIGGVIATGKEACVYVGISSVTASRPCPNNNYHGNDKDDKDDHRNGNDNTLVPIHPCVLKIYHTTVTAFRNRADYRVKTTPKGTNGPHTSSLSVEATISWTRQEYAHLHAAQAAGVTVPTPLFVQDHVLGMQLMGHLDHPAPQLRQVTLTPQAAIVAYVEILMGIQALYQRAGLVHADLSEYNLLVTATAIVFIDFGQAVNVDSHPDALCYLTRDIANINAFFIKRYGEMALASVFVPTERYLSLVMTTPDACVVEQEHEQEKVTREKAVTDTVTKEKKMAQEEDLAETETETMNLMAWMTRLKQQQQNQTPFYNDIIAA